jgi:hypothetical protein
MKKLVLRIRDSFTHNILWLGLGSLIWLIVRSGTKPSRLQYPCQRAAASTSSVFLGAFALPGITRGLKRLDLWPAVPLGRRITTALAIVAIVAMGTVLAFRIGRTSTPTLAPQAGQAGAGIARSGLPAWTARDPNPSHIFVVDSFPNPDTTRPYHEGLDTLLSLLAANGTYFYKSAKHLPWCDTNGIIGKNDVVLLKVNAEWDQRGQTNGDVIKGMIARIVAHPDTFTGEIELVENGQWRQSWAYAKNNAEDTLQTMQSIVDGFAAQGWHVGAYDWTAIGYGSNNRWVSEYDQGDTNSGYVREDSSGMTYAKFMSRYGTLISVRKGIWNGTQYEPDRLKFINMPVLKSHSLMGVSASVKHYIGFLSYAAIGSSTMHSRAMSQGLLGVNFGKARFPDLNIIDATWVMAEGTAGPNAPYNLATRLNALVASKDPIANDWYAGKHVLRPVSWWSGHPWLHDYGRMDPDNLNTENPGSGGRYAVDSTPCSGMPYNAFHQMLTSSRDKMLAYGRQVTMDSTQMTVHVFTFRSPTGISEARDPSSGIVRSLTVTPNPALGQVAVSYDLSSAQCVRAAVYAADGRLVARLAEGNEPAGTHKLVWNRLDESGRRAPPGTYLVAVETDAGRSTQKIVVGDW